MTKHVVSTRQVPHLWAQQNPDQGWAKSGHDSISYRGTDLISYSTTIARFVKDVNDAPVVLIAANRWGSTTGGQISRARQAVSHLTVFSELSDVGRYGEPDHQKNLNAMIQEYRGHMAKLRGMTAHAYRHDLSTARDYAARFGLTMPEIDDDAEWAELVAFRAAREARLNTPAAIARREKDRERREAKRSEEDRQKREQARIAREAYEAGAPERARVEAESTTIALRAFRAGLIKHRSVSDDNGGALVRASDGELQTSHGANVPLIEAIRVFQIARKIRGSERGVDLMPPVKVGGFTVTKIHADGTIQAGCHTIHWPEIERCAVSLDLIEGWAVPAEPRMTLT